MSREDGLRRVDGSLREEGKIAGHARDGELFAKLKRDTDHGAAEPMSLPNCFVCVGSPGSEMTKFAHGWVQNQAHKTRRWNQQTSGIDAKNGRSKMQFRRKQKT